ncbi:hypothetical protein BDZ97DRAFT_403357 [Flammula alnicola]|nr:hypothetical protein BDZ97DRAFT_403357 [Flammula alnicola]
MVITWVDELLAKLSFVLATTASGSSPVENENSRNPESIQSQRRDDALRAATQLPEKWHDLRLVIGSTSFSPAAKRVATFLLFAAYAMAPQLMRIDAWPETSPPPSDILASLYFAASYMSSQVQSPSRLFDPLPQRIMAAMLIVLFSTVDTKVKGHKDDLESPKLRPGGFGCLLDLMRLVMNQETNSILPLEDLDAPQIILLRWGCVVPWSWSTWNDERIANTEYLRSMTATWLYHLNTPLFGLEITAEVNVFAVNLRSSLFIDVAASSLMMMIAQSFSRPEESSNIHRAIFLVFLGKLFWAVIQYLEACIVNADSAILPRIPEYTRCMLTIYTLLGASYDDIFMKSLIIEALTLVPPDTFTISLKNVLKDKAVQFLPKFDEANRTCVRCASCSFYA